MITMITAPYLGYAGMSVEEIAQFKDLLTKAERGDRGAQELVAIHYELGTGISIGPSTGSGRSLLGSVT